MTSTATRNRIESTLEAIRNRDAAYHQLADRFGPLFETRERIRTEMLASSFPLPEIDASRLAAGGAVLAGVDLSQWDEQLRKSAEMLHPILEQVLEMDDENARALRLCLEEPGKLAELARMRMEGDDKQIMAVAEGLGINPSPLLPYVVDAVSGPVIGVIAESLKKALSENHWEQGHCPVCGSTPSMAQLALSESEGSEYLVGGGGKKYLHCSLCGHDWHFKRNACAACGNVDADTREILHQEGKKGERIEICRKCDKYMLVVDMREIEPAPHLDTFQMGLIHLDIIAQQKQFTPVSSTLWNTLE